MEAAAAGLGDQARRAAGDRHELLVARRRQPRDRPQQAPGVRVLRRVEDHRRRRPLDHPAGVHDRHLVGQLGHHAEVVGDHDHRHPQLLLEPLDDLEDLRLDGHVERGGGLVGDQQARLVDQRHGDHRPLAHAAGELVRVVVQPPARVGDADHVEHLRRALAALLLARAVVGAVGLHQLLAHGVVRMHRRQRVLEDHRDVVAAQRPQALVAHGEDVVAVEADLAAQRRVARAGQAHHREARDALPGARFAHDAQRPALLDAERHAVDGVHDPVLGRELDPQVVDLEQGAHAVTRSRLTRGSRVADPGIEQRVGDVDDEVGHDDEEGAEQDGSLDDG
jgi:hypothetical protein